MKNFIINEHSVCTNSNNYILFNEKEGSVEIRTAFINNQWRAGNSVFFSNFGCGGLPSEFDKGFETEKECIEKELVWLMDYLNRNTKNKKFAEKIKESFDKLYPKEIQLSLF